MFYNTAQVARTVHQGPMLWNLSRLQFTNLHNKLDSLSLVGLFSLVCVIHLQVLDKARLEIASNNQYFITNICKLRT